ncbi:MAG: glycoside hydrolase family 127 protein [Clostridia bacterium]|nr:glycoside hydrolase family 127 protein [Clostridia bacterium]
MTYFLTGDEELLVFAVDYVEFLATGNDVFDFSYKSMLYKKLEFNSGHTAGEGVVCRIPAVVYGATGKKEYLKATEKRFADIRKRCTHVTGSPVSIWEYLGPVGATTETEYCSYAYFNSAFSCLSYITGKAVYGDYMEELFYNGAQGGRKKDERAIAYLTAPNQTHATRDSSPASFDMQVYAPNYPTSCCPVNSVVVLPEFIRGIFLKGWDGSVFATAYGPCHLDANGIKIDEITDYPFVNKVRFVIRSDKEFAFYLKIPNWCKGYTLTVNNVEQKGQKPERGYIKLKKAFVFGDEIEITFDAEINVIRVNDEYANKKPLAVKYGALVFSYPIPEKWESVHGRSETVLPDGWSWFDVKPDFNEAPVPDLRERIGLRRNMISWNFALDENLSKDDFQIEYTGAKGYAWEEPKIKLHTHAYKAPYLIPPYPEHASESYEKYNTVTERQEITLVPYGCTNLRITYFPKAKLPEKGI